MIEKVKISRNQTSILVMMFTIGSSILIIPSGLAQVAGRDAWLAPILGLGVGVVLVVFYITLGNRYPTMNLSEYSEVILGKWLGKFVSILYFAFFFLLASLVLRNLGDFLSTSQLINTPMIATHILFLLLVIMALWLGIETFSRAAELFIPGLLFLTLMLILFISPQIDFNNVQPLMENGIKPIIQATIPYIGSPILELVVFLMIFPSMNQEKGNKTGFLAGFLMGGILLFSICLLTILVLGVDLTSRYSYPFYNVAKKVNIGSFIQRIEAIVAFSWFITLFIKLSICFYASTLCLVHTFKLKDNRIVLFPLAIIMLILSIIAYPNTAYFQIFVSETWPAIALIYGLFLPLLLLIVSMIKGKVKKSNRDPKS